MYIHYYYFKLISNMPISLAQTQVHFGGGGGKREPEVCRSEHVGEGNQFMGVVELPEDVIIEMNS